MPKMRISRRGRGGFTLIELMIVVGIIGLLAAIAVPNFVRYQARSRRGEAYANVAALARAQKAYQAERNELLDIITVTAALGDAEPSLPDYTIYNGGDLGTQKMPWDAESKAAFGSLGWAPEGEVFYSYGAYTSASGLGCGACANCFTLVAFGNVDGDLQAAAVLYVHPEEIGGGITQCIEPSGLFTTPIDGNGNPIYDSVAASNQHEY